MENRMAAIWASPVKPQRSFVGPKWLVRDWSVHFRFRTPSDSVFCWSPTRPKVSLIPPYREPSRTGVTGAPRTTTLEQIWVNVCPDLDRCLKWHWMKNTCTFHGTFDAHESRATWAIRSKALRPRLSEICIKHSHYPVTDWPFVLTQWITAVSRGSRRL